MNSGRKVMDGSSREEEVGAVTQVSCDSGAAPSCLPAIVFVLSHNHRYRRLLIDLSINID
ncbi:hypothetical protein J6590_104673 [Homalodisca vitripennis]|nr:hypothetical protein J6590_104673 [Homalodisca vitripennis]